MSTSKIPMTPAGYERLQNELNDLKHIERPNIIQAIAEARAHGDLSENAEYQTARERQGMIEGRIAELEYKLPRVEVIDPQKIAGKRVTFGATITLYDVDAEKEIKYQIVGEDEAKIEQGLLSVAAPLAKATIGKEAGDEVEVNTPNGIKEYEIVKVEFV